VELVSGDTKAIAAAKGQAFVLAYDTHPHLSLPSEPSA
jgi:hypothetical protein